MKSYSAIEILIQRAGVPLLDVRTPAEFANGHIPGAVNMPLFTDEERVVVGTLYVKKGKDAAVEKGLEYVGPKLAGFVKNARKIGGTEKRVNVYCWRGGMRSGSMGWLLETAGMEVGRLDGGYKAYRTFIRQDFERPQKLLVLGGMTGSGKTDILHELERRGEQVLDLEGLANHKGSAFGALGQGEQPTNEMFENLIWEVWHKCDPEKVIWTEDESMSIGSVWINPVLYTQLQQALAINLKVPFESRVGRLLQEYGGFEPSVLVELVHKIERRLGGDKVKKACEDIYHGNIEPAINIVLEYYDKTYAHGLQQKKQLFEVVTEGGDTLENADAVKKIADVLFLKP